jgi:large subunit ribosomal protein L18
MVKKILRKEIRKRKHRLLREKKNIFGTAEKPRLSVCKTLKHIYAQIINDNEGRTLVHVSSLSPEVKASISSPKRNIKTAEIIGKLIAQKAREKGIEKVVFDRGGFRYHGIIKAVADKAREGGLIF